MDIGIYIFSFNRGIYLQNCITSLEKCASDLPVVIIDDNSYDRKTKDILNELSNHHKIIHNEPTQKEKKTGGLHVNMNLVIKDAISNGYNYVLFIQDDMQMVREFTPLDVERIKIFFKCNKNAIQISTSFIKGRYREHFSSKHFIDESKTAYVRYKRFEMGKSNFSDTGIFNVDRFKEIFQKFEVGEANNSKKAQNLGLIKGISVYPFMHWLPSPISFREKTRKPLHVFIEWIGGAGFYPISIMSEEKQEKFIFRDPEILSFTEDFLTNSHISNDKVWTAGGGLYHLTGRGGMVEKGFKFLKKVKRLLKKT